MGWEEETWNIMPGWWWWEAGRQAGGRRAMLPAMEDIGAGRSRGQTTTTTLTTNLPFWVSAGHYPSCLPIALYYLYFSTACKLWFDEDSDYLPTYPTQTVGRRLTQVGVPRWNRRCLPMPGGGGCCCGRRRDILGRCSMPACHFFPKLCHVCVLPPGGHATQQVE